MSNALDHFLSLLRERIKRPVILTGFSPAGKVTQIELPALQTSEQLSPDAKRLIRQVAANFGSLILLTPPLKPPATGGSKEVEVRIFTATLDPTSGAVELYQASRLRAMVLLAKFQLVGGLPLDAKAAGPHLGYQQLSIPGPFA